MAKAVTFQPTVRPDWCGVLSYLGSEEKAEILEAIIRYPAKECKSAFWLETIKPDLDLQFETFVNRCEKNKQCINKRWERIQSNTPEEKENTNEYERIRTNTNEYVLKDEDEEKEKSKSKNNIIKGNINSSLGNTRVNDPEDDGIVDLEELIARTPPKTTTKKKKFTPPTLDEVKSYIAERKLCVDPDKFFNYFDVGNWIDSEGKPVQNWKQKLITWDDKGRKERTLNAARGLLNTGVTSGTYGKDAPL